MKQARLSTLFAAFAAAAMLVDCSGGSSVLTPMHATSPVATDAAPQTQMSSIALTFNVPSLATAARRRTPKYVSASTYQAAVTVTPQNGVAAAPVFVPCTNANGGGKVCAGTVPAQVGVDTVAIALEDQPATAGTHGKVLSEGVVVTVVQSGQSNPLQATLDGVVSSVKVVFAAPQVPYFASATSHSVTVPTYVAINAYDADNNVITYNGKYVDGNDNPFAVALASSALCGGNALCSTTLGATQVSGPGSILPVTATLNDTIAATTESLTITPAVAFGSTTIPVTAGATQFIRTAIPAGATGATGATGVRALPASFQRLARHRQTRTTAC